MNESLSDVVITYGLSHQIVTKVMKLVILFVSIAIINVLTANDVLAQEQMINNTHEINEVNRNLERIN